jgi:predicted DNA-binding transcriptional regulator YafY
MPVTKNATIRYKLLDDLLSDTRHHYTMADLTESVNDRLKDLGYSAVTKRCIEKDIEFLKGRPFCAPIGSFPHGGKDCYSYKKSGFSIFNHELTREEMSILYEVLNTVGQFKGLPNFAWLNGLRANFGMKKHKSVLSFAHNPLLKNSNIMASLYDIVANQQVIKMTYKRFTDADAEVYSIHPYLLKQYNNRWFLFGKNASKKGDISNLPLDRIESITESGVPYEEDDGTLQQMLDSILGVTIERDAKIEEVKLKFSEQRFPYVQTKHLHNSQKTIDDQECIIQINVMPNKELEALILQYGNDVEVLSPESLRGRIKDKIQEMLKKY